jgi:hypothetical protein
MLQDRSRRLQVGPQRARRKAAEHEAAHAPVAEALGLRVHEIVIGDHGSGHVEYEQASRDDTAVIAVAGGLWITTFRSLRYPEGDSAASKITAPWAWPQTSSAPNRPSPEPPRTCANTDPPC